MKKVLFISDQYIFGVIGGSLGHKRFYDIYQMISSANLK